MYTTRDNIILVQENKELKEELTTIEKWINAQDDIIKKLKDENARLKVELVNIILGGDSIG